MRKPVLILLLFAVIFIAGCKSGITGRAVLDQEDTILPTTAEATTTIRFQYQENQQTCDNGVWRKQILPNGTVKMYCADKLIERERCDVDTSCGRDAVCEAGYCRPI